MTIILDALIIVLLSLTIGYAAVLNRKLKRLREGEDEMKTLFAAFNEATAKAEGNLAAIKGMAEPGAPSGSRSRDARAQLAPLVEEARLLAADLDILIRRGEGVAGRIAAPAVAPIRGPAAAPAEGGAMPVQPPVARSQVERELMDALKSAR